jgi:hypothetical protein
MEKKDLKRFFYVLLTLRKKAFEDYINESFRNEEISLKDIYRANPLTREGREALYNINRSIYNSSPRLEGMKGELQEFSLLLKQTPFWSELPHTKFDTPLTLFVSFEKKCEECEVDDNNLKVWILENLSRCIEEEQSLIPLITEVREKQVEFNEKFK